MTKIELLAEEILSLIEQMDSDEVEKPVLDKLATIDAIKEYLIGIVDSFEEWWNLTLELIKINDLWKLEERMSEYFAEDYPLVLEDIRNEMLSDFLLW